MRRSRRSARFDDANVDRVANVTGDALRSSDGVVGAPLVVPVELKNGTTLAMIANTSGTAAKNRLEANRRGAGIANERRQCRRRRAQHHAKWTELGPQRAALTHSVTVSTSDDLHARLENLLGAKVSNLARLSGGASRETWAFDAETASGGTKALILRRDPPSLVVVPSRVGGMLLEARLFAAASGAGVPVPILRASGDADPDVLETGYLIMDHVDGETIARKILRDEPYVHTRSVLVGQLGEAAARLHAITPASVPGLPPIDPIQKYREMLDELGHPSPTFELAFRWLATNRPEPVEPCVVHGDFRLGNVIVDETGLVAVLDWELAHLGDPAEDLGWLCVRAWRFGNTAEVAGLGSVEELLRAYHLANGRHDVDAERVHWWLVAGTLMWGVMCVLQANAHVSGAMRGVELAAIGRRIAEQEHDLLDLLGAPDAETPIVAPVGVLTAVEAGDDVGFPTARILLDAVRSYLEHDVMDATDGRVAFHARVAQNVLGIVDRELVLGPRLRETQARLYASLGTTNERTLADRIKNGSFDDTSDELLLALRNVIAIRIAIANPKYAR